MLRVTQLSGFGIGSGAGAGVRVVAAGAGSYALTGSAANVTPSATAKTLAAAGGSYALSGTAANLTNSGAPPPVTGLIGWWDASKTASLSLTGSDINSIADQSGLGNTMSWTGFGKPSYSATGFNSSFPAILINTAIGNALEATSFPMGTGNTITAWLVTTAGTASSESSARFLSYNGAGTDSGNAGSWCINRTLTDANNIRFTRNSLDTGGASSAIHPTGHRFIATINSSGAGTLYIDGVATGTPFSSAGNWVSNGALNLGRRAPGGGFYITAPVAEFGVATGYSDATAAGVLDAWLQSKWGL